MFTLFAIHEPITRAGLASILVRPHDILLIAFGAVYRFLRVVLLRLTPNPLNIVKGNLPPNRYIWMVPAFSVHFLNGTRNDAIVDDCRVQCGFDFELH